jgi:glycerophosphoryl diester phosphodiesterase
VDCIAHRGFAGVNPENTVQAVRAAASAGADWVEIDVRRCGSGELVVFHDATLDGLTGATGSVAATPLETLQSLSIGDSDAGVPTLAEVFEALPGGVGLNVELKERGLAADCLAVFDRYDTEVLVSSFDADTLQAVAERSSVPLALLFANGPDAALDTATSLGCAAVHPYRRCCDAGFINTAHGAGFDVNAWTVKTETQADRLAALDVDGLIVDAPACCRS